MVFELELEMRTNGRNSSNDIEYVIGGTVLKIKLTVIQNMVGRVP